MEPEQGLALLHEISLSVVYLMGFSFVLGSLFTLLLLALFDMVRSRDIDVSDD